MKTKYLNFYSTTEKQLLRQLDKLFKRWERTVGDGPDSGYWFIPDGFYPGYFSQKPKILYMARDAYDLYGIDDKRGERTYIEKFLRQYLAGRMDDGKHVDGICINRVKFHKMLMQVAYGIVHSCRWNQIPYASEICADGNVFDHVSFAFMNLCKWSHESDDKSKSGTGADWTAINEFVEKSLTTETNFFIDEIRLLRPDIIISMNLGPGIIKKVFGEKVTRIDNTNPNCYAYCLEVAKNLAPILVLDPWHFSARNKDEQTEIYEPLLTVLEGCRIRMK